MDRSSPDRHARRAHSATDLASESRVLGADGAPSVVLRQVLTRVTRERYEAERAAFGAEAPRMQQ